MKHDRSMKHDSPINKAVYKCIQVTILSQSISSVCNGQPLIFPSHYLGFEASFNQRKLGRL